VNVIEPPSAALSATSPQAKSMGCAVADGPALPVLAGAVVCLLRWASPRRPTRRRSGRRVHSGA
jgi:hypothetical protein